MQINIKVFVIVENINDNPPVFAKNLYTLEVNEVELILYSYFKAHASLNSVTTQWVCCVNEDNDEML